MYDDRDGNDDAVWAARSDDNDDHGATAGDRVRSDRGINEEDSDRTCNDRAAGEEDNDTEPHAARMDHDNDARRIAAIVATGDASAVHAGHEVHRGRDVQVRRRAERGWLDPRVGAF